MVLLLLRLGLVSGGWWRGGGGRGEGWGSAAAGARVCGGGTEESGSGPVVLRFRRILPCMLCLTFRALLGETGSQHLGGTVVPGPCLPLSPLLLPRTQTHLSRREL